MPQNNPNGYGSPSEIDELEALLAQQRQYESGGRLGGFGRFLNNLAAPANPIGKFGARILAASGNPLGQAQLAGAQEREAIGARVREIQAGQAEAERRRRAIQGAFGSRPELLALAGVDPSAAARAYAEDLKPVTLSEGQTLNRFGQAPVTAPKAIFSGDQAFSVSPEGLVPLGRREPTVAEKQAAAQAAALAAYRERELAIQQQNANTAARRVGGGSGGAALQKYAATEAQNAKNANESYSLLEEAEKLLKTEGVTGSGLGAFGDAAARFAGFSTKGAQITAALKPIAAKLVATVPRFEGPQGVLDVKLYREAAGALDDPELTVEERLQAINKIRQINSKYAPPDANIGTSGLADVSLPAKANRRPLSYFEK